MTEHSLPHLGSCCWPRVPAELRKFPLLVSLGCASLLFAVAPQVIRAQDAGEQSPPAFEPAEISIGEPIQLPARPAVPPSVRDGSTGAATLQGPGSGWIGLTADDSLVPGRLVVVDVAQPGPAAQAGIRPQDQLLAINGKPLRSSDQLAAELAAIAPGDDVKVAVGRADRIDEFALKAMERPLRTVVSAPSPAAIPAAIPTPSPAGSPAASLEWQSGPVTGPAAPLPPPAAAPSFLPAARPAEPAPFAAPLAAAPVEQPAGLPAAAKGRTALGVRTLPVDQSAQARFGLTEPAGALVIGVVQDLPASKAGVPPGSVIVALGNQPVRSPTELTKLVTSSPADRPITLQYILPGGEQRQAEVSLQSLELPLERALVGPAR